MKNSKLEPYRKFFTKNRGLWLTSLVICDILLIKISLLFSVILTESDVSQQSYFVIAYTALMISAPTVAIYLKSGLYQHFHRYLSAEVYKLIGKGVLAASATSAFINYFTMGEVGYLKVIFFTLFLLFLLTQLRYFLRELMRSLFKTDTKKVAIYGAGEAGAQLLKALQFSSEYTPTCLIDDDRRLHGNIVSGLKILSFSEFKKLAQKLKVTYVLLAIPSSTSNQRKEILGRLNNLGLRTKTIPSINSIISGRQKIFDLSDINAHDLLGRTIVKPDIKLFKKNIEAKTVLVTGAGGSIGSEICKNILNAKPKKLIALDVSEFAIYNLQQTLIELDSFKEIEFIPVIASVSDVQQLESLFEEHKVDSIYHAAAYKHVPLMENNIVNAIKNNSLATYLLVNLAIQQKIKSFTLVSTDKAVNPSNIMGASKRLAELICRGHSDANCETNISIVRFGNVLGSSGSVIPKFNSQIDLGGPITLTSKEITRYFMSIEEAAQLVIQSSSISTGGDIFVLDMGDPVKIIDVVYKLTRLRGLSAYIKHNEHDNYNQTDPLHDKNAIAIEITGLRPGEKMYEELTYDSKIESTVHPKINKVNEPLIGKQETQKIVSLVEKALVSRDEAKIIELLRHYASYTG